MIRKLAVLAMAVGFVFLQSDFSAAWTMSAEELVEAKKAELNNTEWNVAVRSMRGRGQPETDVITFIDGKIFSKNLGKEGFTESIFTVRVEEGEKVIWEAMQKDAKLNYAYWHGSIEDGIMRGVLSTQSNRGRVEDFSFTSE